MASCFFLLRQFEDVLIYLNSIKVNFANKVQIMCFSSAYTGICHVHIGSKRLLKGSTEERSRAFYLQNYFYNDDAFNFNYAQAKAALGSYQEAEEVVPPSLTPLFYVCVKSRELIKCSDECDRFFQYFLMIQNEKIKNDYVYLSWLARCCMYIQLFYGNL